MLQVSQYKWVPKTDAIDTALSWMQPSVRYSLDDVVELPEAIYRTIDVDMTAEQTTAYTQAGQRVRRHGARTEDHRGQCRGGDGQATTGGCRLRLHAQPATCVLDCEPRKQMLLELIDEAPHKVIVFAPWRHLIEGLVSSC